MDNNLIYEGDYVSAKIYNDDNVNYLVIATDNDTFETDEGNLEWDTVIALYAKDGKEPNRFEFTPQPNNNGVALFKMLAK